MKTRLIHSCLIPVEAEVVVAAFPNEKPVPKPESAKLCNGAIKT